jgi:lipopolysaccharide transport system permease protein
LKQRIVIEANTSGGNYWKDLWNFRGLLYFLAWRDVLVRYKQTVIGLAWIILRPLTTIIAFSFLGWFFNIGAPGPSRILFVAAATLPWQFFSGALSDAANSLVGNTNLISKVYFPRLIIPASTVIVCLIDFFITFLILLIIMACGGLLPGARILFLPLFLLIAMCSALGLGVFVSALTVRYRDFKYIIPFMIQLGSYASPIMFSSMSIYESVRLPSFVKIIFALNPMVGIIDGFRWCLLDKSAIMHWDSFFLSSGIGLLFLFIGTLYFRQTEKHFADVI